VGPQTLSPLQGQAAAPGQAPLTLLHPPHHRVDRIQDGQGIAPGQCHRVHHRAARMRGATRGLGDDASTLFIEMPVRDHRE
jgi:hypothetical protein